MSTWRRKAIELLPEHRHLIETSEDPMDLWVELATVFATSAARTDDAALRRFFTYGLWCLTPAAGALPSSASSAAWVGFFENLALLKEFWGPLPQWVSPDEFELIRPAFAYFLDEDEQKEIQRAYYNHAW